MAIFSLHHSAVGRSTHKPGTAAAHLRYITRSKACTQLLGSTPAGVPLEAKYLVRWLRECERGDRINARVIDKLVVALPAELCATERAALVTEFCGTITQNQAPWLAAIHDHGDDAANPHAHIILRDRDVTTGKRVIMSSAKGSTERFREAWQVAANYALERSGQSARIDHRSNKARGIPFAPTIHLGAAEPMERRGIKTVKGTTNRRVLEANDALRKALEGVQEAEAALLAERQRATSRRPKTAVFNVILGSLDGSWRSYREDLLSETYRRAMQGSDLARFWHITPAPEGLVFENKAGRFVDRGSSVTTEAGGDLEIQGMLAVARAKGWTVLRLEGSTEFLKRTDAAAKAAGFAVDYTKLPDASTRPIKPSAGALIAKIQDIARSGATGRSRV